MANLAADRYCVIGNPVEHSRSPQIHTAFAEQHGQSVIYTRLLAENDGFGSAVQQFRADGGLGMNVTVPFKEQAFQLADHCSDRVIAAGAANTLSFRPDGIHADNTDGPGLVLDLTTRFGLELNDVDIVLLGAGGAARGVILPLLQAGVAGILIANRTAEKAIQLVRDFTAGQPDNPSVRCCDLAALAQHTSGMKEPVWINATAAGLTAKSPVSGELLGNSRLAYDMVYSDQPTAFMAAASDAGCPRVADGLGMLVEQAAESFFIWRSVRPQTDDIYRALRYPPA